MLIALLGFELKPERGWGQCTGHSAGVVAATNYTYGPGTYPNEQLLYFAQDVTIQSGADVTFQAINEFAPGVKVIVEAGAKLTLNSAKFTRCADITNDDRWGGIEVHGTAPSPGSPNPFSLRGRVYVINNSTVSWAETGIRGGTPSAGTNNNATIYVNNSTFENCKRSISMDPSDYSELTAIESVFGRHLIRRDNTSNILLALPV